MELRPRRQLSLALRRLIPAAVLLFLQSQDRRKLAKWERLQLVLRVPLLSRQWPRPELRPESRPLLLPTQPPMLEVLQR